MVFYSQFTHFVVHNSLDESLDSKLEIASSKQNISPNVFMDTGILLKECLNVFSINSALLTASIVDVGNVMITQECGEVLRLPNVFTLLHYCRLLHV